MNIQTQVLAAEERLRQAVLHADIAVLDELLSPDFYFTDHLGQVMRKADDLVLHRSRPLHLTSFEPSEPYIQIHADFAIVSVLMRLIGSFQGAPVDLKIRYTRIWQADANGALLLIAGHSSVVQPTS